MCGRFVSVSSADQLAARFDVDEVRAEPLGERYNVAPTQQVYALVDRDATRRLGTLRWGFVPYWATSPRSGPRPINARLETVRDTMFADSFERRRCIVPADGFYEWRRGPDGKQPYLIRDPEGEPLAFAGLWSLWRDAEGQPLPTCAIVTTRAAGPVAELHDRMPVVLPPELWDRWLGSADGAALHDEMSGLGPPPVVTHPVSTRVNDVRNDGPELLEPVG